MATTPEGKIKGALDKMLKRHGVWYFSPQSGPFGRAGIPDRIAIVRGQFVGIECKSDASKKPTALQVQCMNQIEQAGGKSFLVYDKATIDMVEAFVMGDKDAGN